jgi:glycosyltransferase involved in cell wall biosynthesis
VFIEALACGTPILAYRRGSVPEIINNGHTGFICESVDEMVKSVPEISTLERCHCRQIFEQRFTVERMVQNYLSVYEHLVNHVDELPTSSLEEAVNF